MGLFGNLKDGMKSAVQKTVDEKMDAGRARMESSTVGRMALAAAGAAKQPVPAARQSGAPVVTRLWDHQPFVDAVLMDPNERIKVYTYYPDPLASIQTGQRFALEVVPGDCILHSKYSGNVLDTFADGDAVALALNEVIVAACWGIRESAMYLVSQGHRVYLESEKTGVFSKDIPEIVAFGSKSVGKYTLFLPRG